MPFRITSTSEVYQRAMDQLFKYLPCQIIVDDILVWGTNQEDHGRNLRRVLDRARQVQLKLNRQKCKFRLPEVPYVGHLLTADGLCPDKDMVCAFTEMPSPTDVPSLQRFLGMVQYLAKNLFLT